MIRKAKAGFFRLAESSGLSSLLASSDWRRKRLLILCYHGVSMDDEHLWSDLYVSPDTLRRRLQLIRDAGCNVLPLDEALERLQHGDLPPRAVVITFDDGLADFHQVAFPILRYFGFPVTLYLSTYYMEFNRPVFDSMASYLLWKSPRRGQPFLWPGVLPQAVDLTDSDSRLTTVRNLLSHTLDRRLSGQQKDNLLAELAAHLEVDYEDLCHRRILHLINRDEGRELAAAGVDLQLHTHRHRVYRKRERMFAELDDNRERIDALSPRRPIRHFCYTGGFYLPEHREHLRDYGIVSATTCQPGYCTAATDPFLLPRLVDSGSISELSFRAWLTGSAGLIPVRSQRMEEGQLIEEQEDEEGAR